MRPSNIVQVAATGQVTTRTTWVRSVVLTAGAAEAATVELRAPDENGDVLAALSAAIGTSESAEMHEAQFTGGLHATLTGADAAASIVWV